MQRSFTTLENLAAAEESSIAQCLHIKAPEAAEILLKAQDLNAQRNEKKAVQRHSLGVAGTTKEKAAEAQMIAELAGAALGSGPVKELTTESLAKAALLASKKDDLMAAESQPEYKHGDKK